MVDLTDIFAEVCCAVYLAEGNGCLERKGVTDRYISFVRVLMYISITAVVIFRMILAADPVRM